MVKFTSVFSNQAFSWAYNLILSSNTLSRIVTFINFTLFADHKLYPEGTNLLFAYVESHPSLTSIVLSAWLSRERSFTKIMANSNELDFNNWISAMEINRNISFLQSFSHKPAAPKVQCVEDKSILCNHIEPTESSTDTAVVPWNAASILYGDGSSGIRERFFYGSGSTHGSTRGF